MTMRKQYILCQLKQMDVRENNQKKPVETLTYKELKYLLAVKRAAVQ
ncbi:MULTISPECIES: hypothetical protein [unclassified Sporosarcina]|nr:MULTISPECIES: hypothetical protein [unclassified Sporosarcina]